MKRGISAIIIVTLCIVFSTVVNITLIHKAEVLYLISVSAVDDKTHISALEEEWNKQTSFFALFTDHGRFENIGKKIEKLKQLDGELYTDLCTETAIDLKEFREHLLFSLPNVF